MITISKHQGTHITCFSPTCIEVMDFFLKHIYLYFTPTTTALSLDRSLNSIKPCMNLLRRNSYLSKMSDEGAAYYITKENMEFWITDFRNHVLTLHKLKHPVG